ncbi:bifunctional lysylphosphatidylglycerol flippase/synthetase MprF [Leuconostoc mesenteroides]|uniref:bifunctional lysylphosphatidylglycerol flippase/synthetase MprF n=1 Tax=Leuconostoc mesenteroides TaxID=1245 RepID=UPI00235E7A72|nr:bifunctional lysylphosphatidylglycerol flippase/synthetase MprF [Leuconostoc mesenteroides]
MKGINHVLSKLIILVITLVLITQLFIMTREITWHAILSTMNDIAWWQMVLLLIAGFLVIMPTLFNDLILREWQGYGLTTSEMLQRAWLVNVFNLNAGFIGILSVFLRRIFYNDQPKQKPIKPYIQMYILVQSGLLFATVVAFVILILDANKQLTEQLVWLALFILVAIIGIIVSFSKRINIWQSLNSTVVARFIINSVITLFAQVGLFILIGRIIDIDIGPSEIILSFIISSAIALITMTPGTWGSFDVAIIIMLSFFDVARVDSFIWLILYRVSYNLFPLLSAVALLFLRISKRINVSFRGVPHYVAQSVVHQFLIIILYLSGMLLVLAGTMPKVAEQIFVFNHLRSWPVTYTLINQLPNILFGFLILISARGIANRVQRAYGATIVVLLLVATYVFFFYQYVAPLFFIAVILIAVLFSKKSLYRKQFIHSWEEQAVDFLIWATLIISYLALGVVNLPPIHRHFRHVGNMPSMHWWYVGLIIISVVSVSGLALSKFLHSQQIPLGVGLDEARVNKVLTIGDNHYTNLVFLGDKRLYFYRIDDEDVVGIQFRIINNKAMVMGDPFGNEKYFAAAMEQFVNEADVLGYMPVFYEISENIAIMAHEFGYDFFKLGEEALVILDDFSTAGKKMQNIRSEMNQATRAGFKFKVLEPPFKHDVLQQMQLISDEWLAGREEKGYSLGFFDENYLQRGPIAVLEKEGQIEAFATLVTSYTEQQMTVDLMRFTHAAPNGVMDVLFVNVFDYAKQRHFKIFNLGMSPLANVGQHRQSFGRERLANLVYQFGSKVYSFEGLHHYKNKFTKVWQPMYIGYSRKSSIIAVMFGLLKIDNKGVKHAPKSDMRYTRSN